MKTAPRSLLMFGLMVLASCQSSDPMNRRGESRAVRIEFTRPARIYESGDGIFAMVNGTSRVQWFTGRGVELPAYRLKTGAGTTDRNTPDADKGGEVPARFPLSPGETRYFEVDTGNATGPIAVGIMFYPSLSSTNGTMVWSSPTSVPAKRRTL